MNLIDYIERHNKTHIIFDFDATIGLLLLPWGHWVSEMTDYLQTLDTDILAAYRKGEFNSSVLQNKCVEAHGNAAYDAIWKITEAFETRELQGVRWNDGLVSLLPQLTTTNFLWTSNSTATIVPILKKKDIEQYFSKVITRDDVRYIKPRADGFSHIHDAAIPLDHYLFVGDSSADQGAAAEAGIDFYHIDYFD